MPWKKTAKKCSQKTADKSTPNREILPPATRHGKWSRTDDEDDCQETEKQLQTSKEQSTPNTETTADISNIIMTVLKSLSDNNLQNLGSTPNTSTTSGKATTVASGNSNPTPTRATNDDSPHPLTAEDISSILGAIVGNHSRQTNLTVRDLPNSSFSDLGKHLIVNTRLPSAIVAISCCYALSMTMHGRHAFVVVPLHIYTCHWHSPYTLYLPNAKYMLQNLPLFSYFIFFPSMQL